MDPAGVNTGAKAALGSLKDAYNIGKEGGKFATEVQSENHTAVMSQQKQREAERRAKERAGSLQEQKAFGQFTEKHKAEKATAELKAFILAEYGSKAWAEFLALKIEVEKQDAADAKLIKSDEHKINELFWWCLAAATFIVYFLTVA